MSESNFQTPQEQFWAGEFGDAYLQRNQGSELLARKTAHFVRMLNRCERVDGILELGCNIGLNLVALRTLFPNAALHGLEINAKAAAAAQEAVPTATIVNGSILAPPPLTPVDLTMTIGVLIHLNPDALPDAYDTLFHASTKHILVCEYYNPSPVTVPYRGHSERLYKRDFAGELMDRHPSLQLVDYGFLYRRDPLFPADDTNWFLLRKPDT